MNNNLTYSRPTLYSETDKDREKSIEAREGTESYRGDFRRDYARLIYSPSFRRLQGKTQLFPGTESDFFRNRLTHSLEVAQIAKTIALKLNKQCTELAGALQDQKIDCDLVELAALAHDIGHPPFGHNGEAALNDCMRRQGGFEGNAQTLRVLARLEKRLEKGIRREEAVHKAGHDNRIGLNLTYRSLASVLKYDSEIPLECGSSTPLNKGYYGSEAPLISKIKKAVDPHDVHRTDTFKKMSTRGFKTIECQIMDISDDIAYSTYDLEDAFKAEFVSPLRLLATLAAGDGTLDRVVEKVNRNLERENIPSIDKSDLFEIAQDTFGRVFEKAGDLLLEKIPKNPTSEEGGDPYEQLRETLASSDSPLPGTILRVYESSRKLCVDGYLRSNFTAELVNEFVGGVDIKYNRDCPALSTAHLNPRKRVKVEILKHLTYELITMSPRLRVVEYRGYDLVREIFQALDKSSDYYRLLPHDYRSLYEGFEEVGDRKRALCDFVASMTDRYALEFHARLKGAGESIFKPF